MTFSDECVSVFAASLFDTFINICRQYKDIVKLFLYTVFAFYIQTQEINKSLPVKAPTRDCYSAAISLLLSIMSYINSFEGHEIF